MVVIQCQTTHYINDSTFNDSAMKYIISRYNQDISWVKDYTTDAVIYDRSEETLDGIEYNTIKVQNRGSDIYDKLTYIIDHYHELPDVAVYTKANLFKYIKREEFDLVKDNTTFTPLLTKYHKTYLPTCFYSEDGMYNEINNQWYLLPHPAENPIKAQELAHFIGLDRVGDYVKFAPGSNYILPRENILKHSLWYYTKLKSYLEWSIYPGEAQMIERALYTIWS